MLNIFKNRFTKTISFETLYETKSRNFLINIFRKKSFSIKIEFMNAVQQIRINIVDVVYLIQIKMAIF